MAQIHLTEVPDDLHAAARAQSEAEGMKWRPWVFRVLREYLDRHAKKEAK